LLIAQENYEEAPQLLNGLREAAQAADRRSNVIQILTLQALALKAKDEKTWAMDVMGRALALGEVGRIRAHLRR
jgi:hypothetical protein